MYVECRMSKEKGTTCLYPSQTGVKPSRWEKESPGSWYSEFIDNKNRHVSKILKKIIEKICYSKNCSTINVSHFFLIHKN